MWSLIFTFNLPGDGGQQETPHPGETQGPPQGGPLTQEEPAGEEAQDGCLCESCFHSSTHSFIQSFIHSFIHSFIRSLIHSFIDLFMAGEPLGIFLKRNQPEMRLKMGLCESRWIHVTHCIHSSIHSFIHPFIHSFIHSFIRSLIHSFIGLFMVGEPLDIFLKRNQVERMLKMDVYVSLAFIHPLIHSFIHSSTHSFIHSFIHSFVHSFIHSLVYLWLVSHSASLKNNYSFSRGTSLR